MAVIYSIQIIGGDTAAVACRDLTVRRVTGGVSTCTFFVPGPADAAPAWPYGTEVAVLRSGVAAGSERLFRGSVTATRHVADGTSEGVAYTVSDAWWHLEREIYKAERTVIAEGATTRSTVNTSRILLFRTLNGSSRVSAAGVVGNVRAYAAAMGVPIAAGTLSAPILPPSDEVSDRTCAEIILRALRWQPDAVAWLDHSAEPPTLNVTRIGAMGAVSLPFAGLLSCDIQARSDLVVPGVEIAFDYADVPGRTVAVRTAGDPLARGCARMSITLDYESGVPGPVQEIKVAPLGDYTSASWWRAIFRWLPSDATITEPSIMPVQPEGFTNILLAGQINAWMTDEYEVEAGRYTVSCKAGFESDGHTYTEKELSRSFTLTNAVTKRYRGHFEASWREPIPENLAADFYGAASVLQYEGKITVRETECLSAIGMIAKKIKVSGGREEWSTMSAVVTSVTHHFDSGETEIAFGPQPHLGPHDMVEVIRASRFRTKVTMQTLNDLEDDITEVDPFAPEDRLTDSPGQLSGLDIIYEEVP